MKKISVYMLIIGKITGEILQFILMNLLPVLIGKPKKWYMIIFVGVKMELLVICVMAGNNSLIILFLTKPTSVKKKIVEKDLALIIILKNKEELLTILLQQNALNSFPKTELPKVFSRMAVWKQALSLNLNLKKFVQWFIRSNK